MTEDKNIPQENSLSDDQAGKEQIPNPNNEEVNKNILPAAQPESQEQPIDQEQSNQTSLPDLPPWQAGEISKSEIENMEVHHHPHLHHKKKHWKEYFLEFLMIFLAVTLGFFAESYREYSVEKSRAAEYARSLVHDLEKDTAMAHLVIENTEFLNGKIDSLANYLRDKKIDEITNVQLFAYTHFICLYKPYTWSRATLEEIKSSGSLRYFNNDSILMRISAYDALTKHLDADFNGDYERSNIVAEKTNLIVDLSYASEDSLSFRSNPESTIRIVQEEIDARGGDFQLLTNNINDIKSLLNDYIFIRRNFNNRQRELRQLVEDAEELILMLRNEYDFK